MKVPFTDPSREYVELKDETLRRVEEVFASGEFVLGKQVRKFEEEFANYCGADHAVGVNSGTDALFLALRSLNIQSGDEVIVPALTFIASANVVNYCGGVPVFVDVLPDTLNLDPALLERAITEKTKAILVVHFHGRPADMDAIKAIADKHSLYIIEDCAQAAGAAYKGRKVGTLGEIACFSFYPTKNLGACGDGGMVVTDDEAFALKVRSLRDYGRQDIYSFDLIGYNSRLDEIQAAILSLKLNHLDLWNEKRRELAVRYTESLSAIGNLEVPAEKDFARHVFWVYTIKTKHRDQLKQDLMELGVGTHIIYAVPIPFQKAFQYLNHKKGDFPVSERSAEQMISLPLFPGLTMREQDYVIEAVHKCMRAY